MTLAHRIMGFVMILAINLAVSSGITRYMAILSSFEVALRDGLIGGNLLFWLIAIVIGEIHLYRTHK